MLSGNMLKVKTNFSRRDFSYGGNEVEYEIPNERVPRLEKRGAAHDAFFGQGVELVAGAPEPVAVGAEHLWYRRYARYQLFGSL
mgnify:CR=1 FL=1